jgi:hypothetical protein
MKIYSEEETKLKEGSFKDMIELSRRVYKIIEEELPKLEKEEEEEKSEAKDKGEGEGDPSDSEGESEEGEGDGDGSEKGDDDDKSESEEETSKEDGEGKIPKFELSESPLDFNPYGLKIEEYPEDYEIPKVKYSALNEMKKRTKIVRKRI